MGTDIHAVWQTQKDGKWIDIASVWEQTRHYLLFSFLANVRNGYGFAGVPTYAPIKPIAEPRGYPDDFEVEDDIHKSVPEAIDPRRAKYMDEEDGSNIWMGDHSHSWLMLDEIINAKRTPVHRTGVVDRAWFDKWDGITPPESWSGGISGAGIVVSAVNEITDATTHVQINWADSDNLDYFIDEVKRLRELHGENTRLVFGFDS